MLQYASRLLTAVCVLWLTGCGPAEPALPHLPPAATLLAFGDSLTFGTGTDPANSYPAILKQLSGRQVINAGVPGELSATGLQRLPGLLQRWHPDLLLLCHGGNDLLRRHSQKALQNNLQQMIDLAQRHAVPVLLIAVPAPGLFLQAPDLYTELGEHNQIPVENDALTDILAQGKLKSDQVHPNAKGYHLLAERLLALLQRSGAL